MAQAPEVAHKSNGLEYDQENDVRAYKYFVSDYSETYAPPYPETNATAAPAAKPEILGLKRQTFWFIIVLAVIVISVAVGGGVGGSIAVQNAKYVRKRNSQQDTDVYRNKSEPVLSPSVSSTSNANQETPTPTANATASEFVPPIPTGISNLNITCPSSGRVQIYNNQMFNCTEGSTWSAGDIAALYAYSLQDCAAACWGTNQVGEGARSKKKCVAVTMANNPAKYGTNCWLKGNTTGSAAAIDKTSLRLCQDAQCSKLFDHAD
jgi:hypothetical protein